jgi:hypothetical protein
VGSTLEIDMFRPSKIKEAFEAFVKHSHSAKYKFCLFIDGLDECEGDALDQRLLAESLSRWAEQDNLKICTSARPNIEFLTTIPGIEQTTIHLHNLNRGDIWRFSRQMFEEDRNFDDVQSYCIDLVVEIVNMSQGVFLWAFLVVRLLLSSLSQKDSVLVLRRKLRAIPKDLNSLYRKLLDSIDDSDRSKANLMLLLVLKNPWDKPLNAITFSWLDDLDETFPSAHMEDFQPYSSQELNDRLLRVDHQLHGISKGLLEVTSGSQPTVQFFHRTLHDYLLQPDRVIQLYDSVTGFDENDYYGRLKIAEIAFIIGHTNVYWLFDLLTSNYVQSGRMKHQTLDCLEMVMTAGKRKNIFRRYYMMGNLFERTYSKLFTRDSSGCSLVHAAAFFGLGDYVFHKVSKNPMLLQPREGLHLLLSRATGALSDESLDFRSLLQFVQAGIPVKGSVVVRGSRSFVPVWLLVSGLAINRFLRVTSAHEFREGVADILTLLQSLIHMDADKSCSSYVLETGLCYNCFTPMRYNAQGLYMLQLGEFIEQLQRRDELVLSKCEHETYNRHSVFPGEDYRGPSPPVGLPVPFHSNMLRNGIFRVIFIRSSDVHLNLQEISWRIS